MSVSYFFWNSLLTVISDGAAFKRVSSDYEKLDFQNNCWSGLLIQVFCFTITSALHHTQQRLAFGFYAFITLLQLPVFKNWLISFSIESLPTCLWKIQFVDYIQWILNYDPVSFTITFICQATCKNMESF